jgi:DNA-binding transcriptional ArsR family regulator
MPPQHKSRSGPLAETVAVFRRWLHLPDPAALYAVLGAVAANRLSGDPVWLLLVGSPSSGKSEILQAVGSLPDVYPTATLTEAGLLSGTPKREKDKGATGGLLRVIGNYGIILAKDFGSVLSLHHDSRAQVLAALREVYDGEWTRTMGTDGGKTLSWSGKVGLLAGCTPTIDRHQAVMGAMGERFVLLRLPDEADAHEQGRKALAHSKHSEQMRTELSAAVATLFEQRPAEPPERSEHDSERLVNLAVLVVRCRSAVERDGYTREVELIPGPEAPARLVIVLDHLLDGLLALGTAPEVAWHVVQTAALDSIPALRRKAMTALLADGEMRTAELAEAIGYPLRTSERTLDDLVAHGIAVVNRYGQGKPTTWQISEWTAKNYAAATSPEKSDGFDSTSPEKSECISTNRCTHTDDLSGDVAQNGHEDWPHEDLQALIDSEMHALIEREEEIA